MEIPVRIRLHPGPTNQQREMHGCTQLPVLFGAPGRLRVSVRVRHMGSMSQLLTPVAEFPGTPFTPPSLTSNCPT